MKRSTFLTAGLITMIIVTVSSCGGKREPGRIYMPDMAYSRAYETYALRDSNLFTEDVNDRGHKIFYNNQPVAGTIKRDELFPYTLLNDSNGYKMSAAVKNPLGPLTHIDSLKRQDYSISIVPFATGQKELPMVRYRPR